MKHHINRMYNILHAGPAYVNAPVGSPELVLTTRLFGIHDKLSCTLKTFWRRRREARQETGTSQHLNYGFKTQIFHLMLKNITNKHTSFQTTPVLIHREEGVCMCVCLWRCYSTYTHFTTLTKSSLRGSLTHSFSLGSQCVTPFCLHPHFRFVDAPCYICPSVNSQ